MPIEYGDAEKYIKRLRGDPELLKKTQIVLPRMSYEMTGFSYDSSRKLNTTGKNFASSPVEGANGLSMYNPVPYDFDFNLTIYVRNVEDGNQIIEQIVPYFTPDYTLKLNLVPEMNMIKNVPFVLKSVEQIIESDGDFSSEVRTIMWTLRFTAKAFIFGAVKDVPLIANSTVNLVNGSTTGSLFSSFDGEGACCSGNFSKYFKMSGEGNYYRGEVVYQGHSLDYAYASGKVQEWDSKTKGLIITAICGTFKLNQPIIGTDSLTTQIPFETSNNINYFSININNLPEEYVFIDVDGNILTDSQNNKIDF